MQLENASVSQTMQLVEFCANLRFEHLDDSARHGVRRHLLDTLGAIIAGTRSAPACIAAQTVSELEAPGDVPVPGMNGRLQRLAAAYLMGVSAHGLEVDDGYRAGSVHPGSPVIPAVLAASWGNKVDGRRLAAAIAAAYEVVTRVAEAVHPMSRRRGFHNTSITGVLGAAVGASLVLGLDSRKTGHALGIAASSAAGLFAFLHGGGEIKRLHPGFAAREGLLAAYLAKNGMTGPVGVLEIEDGFLQAFGGEGKADGLVARLGETFNVSRCYIKPHACCRHLHPGVDAVIAIMRETGLRADEIAGIEIGTYRIAAGHAHGGWRDMPSAQMNYQFCVALAGAKGRIGIAEFHQSNLADSALAQLAGKVEVRIDPACEADYPRLRSAHVVVKTTAGAEHSHYVDEPLGSARHPLGDEALMAKFDDLVTPVLGAAESARLKTAVFDIESVADTDALLVVQSDSDIQG